MSREVGAPTRLLEEGEKERLESLRLQGRAKWDEYLQAGPTDALGALAWLVGVSGSVPSGTEEMKRRIDQAREENFTWRQIADALGEGDSPEAGRRVMDRRKLWG